MNAVPAISRCRATRSQAAKEEEFNVRVGISKNTDVVVVESVLVVNRHTAWEDVKFAFRYLKYARGTMHGSSGSNVDPVSWICGGMYPSSGLIAFVAWTPGIRLQIKVTILTASARWRTTVPRG